MTLMKDVETENIEIALILEAIHAKYGYDFREYARASIKRRIMRRFLWVPYVRTVRFNSYL